MIDLKLQTIRPGIMLHLSVKLSGGVEYQREDKEKRIVKADPGQKFAEKKDMCYLIDPEEMRKGRRLYCTRPPGHPGDHVCATRILKPAETGPFTVGSQPDGYTFLSVFPQARDGLVESWATTKTTRDIREYERAVDCRAAIRNSITRLCARSPVGDALLVPPEREEELDKVIEAARALAKEHNATARFTRVDVSTIKARIEASDVETARSISMEIREMLDRMERAIKATDPDAIRDAANKARSIGAMLTDSARDKVNDAITQAREAAREIAKRVGKAGETAAKVVAQIKTDAIESARFAFLDLEVPATAAEPIAPVVGAVDFTPAESDPTTTTPKMPEIDF